MQRRADWQAFIRTDAPKLFRYFCGRFDRATAADLVQETLIRLMKKIHDGVYQANQGELICYAFGIASFVAMEATRSHRRIDRTLSELERTQDSEAFASDIDDAPAILRSAILKLSDQEQEIVLLMIDRDLTLAQIASITNLPLNTVKSHMHRAKQNLRQIFAAQNLHREDLL